MIKSKLAISSDDYYSCELTKRIPVRVTVLTVSGPVGLGFYEALDGRKESIDKYVHLMKKSPQIADFKLTYRGKDKYWTKVKHKLDYPSINETILESGSMTILPIIIERGIQYHTILSPTPDAFRALLSMLEERFTTITLRALSSKPAERIQDLLTDKQYEAFALAYKKGYYDIPRKCTLSELAEELGIKRVAMQERIRRTELKIIEEFAESRYFL